MTARDPGVRDDATIHCINCHERIEFVSDKWRHRRTKSIGCGHVATPPYWLIRAGGSSE